MAKKETKDVQVEAPTDENEKQVQRVMVPVQTVGKAHRATYTAIDGHGMFANTGGAVTWVTAVNNSSQYATITFVSTDGKQDRQYKVEKDHAMDFANFAPSVFNQFDNSIYFEVEGELMIAVKRLGV